MLRAVDHGMQAALMAPTETLADQHFATIQSLLGGESVTAALLTGSTPGARRADALAKLASGELSLVVGTHALIERDVVFDRLAVAVVDEQHRFGVEQRRALDRKAPGTLTPARPPPDGDADPAHARPHRLRGPRHDRAAGAAQRAQARRDPCGEQRARAGAGLRAHPRGAAGRAPGLRRLPARRGVRGPPGPRGDGRVRAARQDRAAPTSTSCCCTARCARAPSRRRWRRSPPAAPTCSWPPR